MITRFLRKTRSSRNQLVSLAPTLPHLHQHTFQLQQIGDSESRDGEGLKVSCFTEVFDDVTLQFQIIRLAKLIYVWVGCNSAKFGNLYAAASTRPSNTVSVTSVLGGTSDNTGYGIARRLVMKTGLNIILACNISKNNPLLEAKAEKVLIRKLIDLAYTMSTLLRAT